MEEDILKYSPTVLFRAGHPVYTSQTQCSINIYYIQGYPQRMRLKNLRDDCTDFISMFFLHLYSPSNNKHAHDKLK